MHLCTMKRCSTLATSFNQTLYIVPRSIRVYSQQVTMLVFFKQFLPLSTTDVYIGLHCFEYHTCITKAITNSQRRLMYEFDKTLAQWRSRLSSRLANRLLQFLIN